MGVGADQRNSLRSVVGQSWSRSPPGPRKRRPLPCQAVPQPVGIRVARRGGGCGIDGARLHAGAMQTQASDECFARSQARPPVRTAAIFKEPLLGNTPHHPLSSTVPKCPDALSWGAGSNLVVARRMMGDECLWTRRTGPTHTVLEGCVGKVWRGRLRRSARKRKIQERGAVGRAHGIWE